MEIGNLPEKIIQSSTKDDPRSQKKNGGTDWEDTRNIWPRDRRFKEQTKLTNTVTEMKNTLERINSAWSAIQEHINNLENRIVDVT